MGLNNCCLKYARSAQPKKEDKAVFSENHSCPVCKQFLKITFQEIVTMGEGLSEYDVIGIDPVDSMGTT